MKLVFLNGGLANQIFQYIFYRYAEISFPEEEWILDDSFFDVHAFHQGYELGRVFGLTPDLLRQRFDTKVWRYMIELKQQGQSIPEIFRQNGDDISMVTEADNYTQWNPFNGKVWRVPNDEFLPEILKLPGEVYYHGYWIRPEWFRSIEGQIREELTFPDIKPGAFDGETEEQCFRNKTLMDMIMSEDVTSVHVRRGDYVSGGIAIGDAWYREQIEKVLLEASNTRFVVFSDDPEYCRIHRNEMGLDLTDKVNFVTDNQNICAFRDLQLMSHCKRMIIGNSAFSYLAALLNKEAIRILKPRSRLV